jgi:peptide/nickel transport system ATP-binding protein
MPNENAPVLEVKDLSVKFRRYGEGLRQQELEVISNLSVRVKAGQVLAVIGSSGSGKSLLAHAILGILPSNAISSGEMLYRGEALTRQRKMELRGREIALVPQSVSYLDPLMKVGEQVKGLFGSEEARRRVFQKYDLQPEAAGMYPFQLSGGMARRALVSTAVISEARLIIADEPTPGLHPSLAQETVRHLRELADQGRAVMLITHELDLAFRIADQIAVFYGGATVELAGVEDFRQGPHALRHPYSKALWAALPENGFKPIPGFQPYAGQLPPGCLFAPRCPQKTGECLDYVPMRELRGGMVRCCHAS